MCSQPELSTQELTYPRKFPYDVTYSENHRTWGDELRMVDIDNVELDASSGLPVAFIETTTKPPKEKPSFVTRWTAQQAQRPAFTVQVHYGGKPIPRPAFCYERIDGFTVATSNGLRDYSLAEYIDFLRQLRTP